MLVYKILDLSSQLQPLDDTDPTRRPNLAPVTYVTSITVKLVNLDS